jgi:hypothetical protein
MGRGIGNINLGMTLPQVRRALGGRRHALVYRNINFGTGRCLELGWELPGPTSWDPVIWQIGFRSWWRGQPLRVTRVATTARRERTSKRIGIGSRPRDIVRAYPSATCIERPYAGMPFQGTWIVVEKLGVGMTAFMINEEGFPGPSPTPTYVSTVMVQRRWFSKPPGHQTCSGDWENW